MSRALLFAHLLGLGVYLGSTVLLTLALNTLARGEHRGAVLRERYAALFRAYNPLAIGSLGVVVMTGAWAITPYKQRLGPRYFAEVGSALTGKLALAFLLILIATWIAFGICHRLVRAHDAEVSVSDEEISRLTGRLRVALWLALAVFGATLWVALGARLTLAPA